MYCNYTAVITKTVFPNIYECIVLLAYKSSSINVIVILPVGFTEREHRSTRDFGKSVQGPSRGVGIPASSDLFRDR